MTKPTPIGAGTPGIRGRLRTLGSNLRILIPLFAIAWLARSSKDPKSDGAAPSGTATDNASSSSQVVVATAPAGETNSGWLGDLRRSIAVDCSLLALAIITVVVSVVATSSAARLLLVLAATCFIPGAAVLTRLSVDDLLEGFTLAVALSFSVEAAGSLAMVWTSWWHPYVWAIILVSVACSVLMLDLRRNLVALGGPTPDPVGLS